MHVSRPRLMSRFWGAFCASLFLSASLQAGLFEEGKGLDDPLDRAMDIYCGDELLGTLEIKNYYSWTSSSPPAPITFNPQNPGLDPNKPANGDRGGAFMEAEFTPSVALCDGCEYRWIQGVMDGTGTIGPPPYLDPFNRDDGLPWYWTEDENSDPDVGNGGLRFSDIPSQPISNSGNSIHFEAAFVVVKMDTMEICVLKTFTWGYSLGDNNVVLDDFEWQAGPSGDLVDLINYWDGGNDENNGYAGDGDPDGWVVVEECPCCECIPEVGSTTMMMLGSCFAGGFVWIRRRRA